MKTFQFYCKLDYHLLKMLLENCNKHKTKLFLSELKYCSDIAAMIGRVAVEQYKNRDFVTIEEIDVQTRIKEF